MTSFSAPQTVTNDGLDQTITGVATDLAGNTNSVTVHINLDKTAPDITYSLSPLPNADGWNNQAVTVTFQCNDATSGIASCSDPVTVSAESSDQAVTGTAVDKAGNVSQVTADVRLDLTAPTIAYTLAPAPNTNGWNNTDVIVSFTCNDLLSGIKTCPDPVTVSTEGQSQQVTGTTVDYAGNTASVTAVISLDRTPPTIGHSLDHAPNTNGWNNTPVTVTYSCNDALSGIATCPGQVSQSADGIYDLADTTVDKAANTATDPFELKIDKTLPTITYAVSPAPNAQGWNNGDVTVTFTCHDDTSGIAFCTSIQTVSTEGGNILVQGKAIDNAGNEQDIIVPVKLDKTNPSITYQVTPAPNAHGWYKGDATVTFTCTDPAGDSLDPTSASGVDSCPGPVPVSSEGSNQPVTGTVTDNAGNTSSVTVYINLDKTSPTITPTITPAPNANGWNHSTVTVSFTCSDALSGIDFCEPPATIDWEEANIQLAARATDKAGNSTDITVPIKIDETAPTIASVLWDTNPLMQGQNTTLTAFVTDTLSGLAHVYYSIEGGTPQPMTYDTASGSWKAAFGSTLPVGTYNVGVWAVDNADNAGPPLTDVLAVTNAANGHVSGHAWVTPSTGDVLPIALDTDPNPLTKMVVGFSGQQGATTSVDVHYIIQNNQDEFDFSSTRVDWVVVPDSTHASILVHGNLTTYVGGVQTVTTDMALRLDITLGADGTADQVMLKFWSSNQNAASDPPLYQTNDADLPNQSHLIIS